MSLRVLFANIWATIYYSVTKWFPNAKIADNADLNRKGKVIVSLTTKPSRIHKTWLVIESLLRQTDKPDALMLCLSRQEFKDENCLPLRLIKLKERGLRIVFTEDNLKPHNKYIYALKAFPEADIVTVDDDKIYPADLIGNLKNYHRRYPEAICAVITRKIKFSNNAIAPYAEWKIPGASLAPSHSLLSLGVGGVLIPGGSLHPDLFNTEVLKEKAIFTDDLWIKVMALRNNTPVASLAGFYRRSFITIRGLQADQLRISNISKGENDLVFANLLDYYDVDRDKLRTGN